MRDQTSVQAGQLSSRFLPAVVDLPARNLIDVTPGTGRYDIDDWESTQHEPACDLHGSWWPCPLGGCQPSGLTLAEWEVQHAASR